MSVYPSTVMVTPWALQTVKAMTSCTASWHAVAFLSACSRRRVAQMVCGFILGVEGIRRAYKAF
jgi:hypothetical protein